MYMLLYHASRHYRLRLMGLIACATSASYLYSPYSQHTATIVTLMCLNVEPHIVVVVIVLLFMDILLLLLVLLHSPPSLPSSSHHLSLSTKGAHAGRNGQLLASAPAAGGGGDDCAPLSGGTTDQLLPRVKGRGLRSGVEHQPWRSPSVPFEGAPLEDAIVLQGTLVAAGQWPLATAWK